MAGDASSLIFYTNPMSRGQIARWALHEAGADYDQQIMEYDSSMKSPEYLAINPMGKVPAIVHEGRVVTECAAICAYLADSFPDAGLAPALEERADYYRWMFFGAGPLESAVTNRALGFNVEGDQQRMAGYGNFDLVLDTLDQLLRDRDYVCGDRFTMADVYLGSQIIWGLQFGSIDPRPSFAPYGERLEARKAYVEAKAIDMDLMPETTG